MTNFLLHFFNFYFIFFKKPFSQYAKLDCTQNNLISKKETNIYQKFCFVHLVTNNKQKQNLKEI